MFHLRDFLLKWVFIVNLNQKYLIDRKLFELIRFLVSWKWFYMKGTKLLQDLDGFVKRECRSALMLEWFDMRCEDDFIDNFSHCFHKALIMFPTSLVTWYKPDVNSFLFYGLSIIHFVSGWRPTRFQCQPQSPWDQFGFWIGLDLVGVGPGELGDLRFGDRAWLISFWLYRAPLKQFERQGIINVEPRRKETKRIFCILSNI